MNYGKALIACGAVLVTSVAIGVTAAPLHARPPQAVVVTAHPDDFVTRRISYADLNLAALPGERTLNRRIGYAVTSLCDEAIGGSTVDFTYKNCTYGAWRDARPQVALAAQRAREIAANGTSLIAAAAISISLSD
jgi:UrcA family protein